MDRKLIVNDNSINEVHFCNRTDECSLVCAVYDEDGLRLVDVPNILLQQDWRINVYGYDKNYTKHSVIFDVHRRTRPEDYIYTENQIKVWDALEERVEAIERTGAADLNDYYTKEEVDNALASVEVDLTDYYTKDETDALIPSTSGLATEDYVDEKFNSIEIPEAESGVYVGVEEPTDDSVVWINPEGDGVSLEQIVQEAVDAAVGDVDLSEYAKKTDIPDTTGFTTMSAVEAKGYQTEAQVNSLINTALGVIENGTY